MPPMLTWFTWYGSRPDISDERVGEQSAVLTAVSGHPRISRQAEAARTDEGVVPVEDDRLLDELGDVGLLHVRVALLVPDHVRPAEVVDPRTRSGGQVSGDSSSMRGRHGAEARSAETAAAEPGVGARTW